MNLRRAPLETFQKYISYLVALCLVVLVAALAAVSVVVHLSLWLVAMHFYGFITLLSWLLEASSLHAQSSQVMGSGWRHRTPVMEASSSGMNTLLLHCCMGTFIG